MSHKKIRSKIVSGKGGKIEEISAKNREIKGEFERKGLRTRAALILFARSINVLREKY